MRKDVVFIHGAGLAGAAAWPLQAAEQDESWHFLPREGIADVAERDADRILDRLSRTRGGHVVAHSHGANAAILAAQKESGRVRSITLLEPACFDLARGMPAVEEHIEAMTPVFERARDPQVSTRQFSQLFARGMGFDPPDLTDDELEERVMRLRALRPPWDVGLQSALKRRTIVITGGARPLYEETAKELTRLGAQHLIIDGATHRVQDHPRATNLIRDWLSEQG